MRSHSQMDASLMKSAMIGSEFVISRRKTQKMPSRIRRSPHTRDTARFVRKHRADDTPFAVGEFVAHDSKLQFKSLNHVYADATNTEMRFLYQPPTGRGT
jgi:hypothetical protein